MKRLGAGAPDSPPGDVSVGSGDDRREAAHVAAGNAGPGTRLGTGTSAVGEKCFSSSHGQRTVGGVCTCGADRLATLFIGNPPRRVVRRLLGAMTGHNVRCDYLALYDINRTTPEKRPTFQDPHGNQRQHRPAQSRPVCFSNLRAYLSSLVDRPGFHRLQDHSAQDCAPVGTCYKLFALFVFLFTFARLISTPPVAAIRWAPTSSHREPPIKTAESCLSWPTSDEAFLTHLI